MKNLHNHNGFTLPEVIFSIMLVGILGSSLFIMQSSMLKQVQKIEELMDVGVKIHNTYIQYLFQEVFKDKTQTDAVKEYPGFTTDTQESAQFENLQFLKINAKLASGRTTSHYYPVLKPDDEKDEKQKST